MIARSISGSKKVNKHLYHGLKDDGFHQPLLGPLLFSWLLPHTDDFGRFEADPYGICQTVIPGLGFNDEDVEPVIRKMEDVRLIVTWKVDGVSVGQIVKFDRFQTGLTKRTRSLFPEPPPDVKKRIDEMERSSEHF